MNPRELLARLNVPAVRYEIGRGGIPELTNIDIAGALGMVKDEFAREVFSAIWWPDGAKLSRNAVGKMIFERIMGEYVKRERAITAAKLELHMAEGEMALKRFPTEYDKQIMSACKRNVSVSKARHWPWNPEVYSRIGNVVIDEKRFPARCPDCQGRSEVRIGDKIHKCERCEGTGIKNRPIIWRASQLGISDKAFVQSWGGIYEWTVRIVSDAEATAANELRDAIASEPVG